MTNSSARLLIADGHPLMHEGLVHVAQDAIPSTPIDTARTIAEIEALARKHSGYRLAIIGTDLPDTQGLSGFLQVQGILGHVPIIILSDHTDAAMAGAARELGAAGYFSKTWPVEQLVTALRDVLSGDAVFPPASNPPDRTRQIGRGLQRLSAAQLRVLVALTDGRSNKQIAGDLGVTEATVKAHLSAAFRKLGVQNRAQALIAMQPLLAQTS